MHGVGAARESRGSSAAEQLDTSALTRRLDALLELARVSRESPLDVVLETVADVVESVVGFSTLVVNIYRPEWDDFHVVLVRGPQESADALMHTCTSRERWLDDVLQPAIEIVPGAFLLLAENHEVWARIDNVFTPRLDLLPDVPDQWLAEDGLFVTLKASDGRLLGILSLDCPVSRRRPTKDDLEMAVAVANHAALALESAHDATQNGRQRQTLTNLLDVSFRLASQKTLDGVLDQICASAVPDLGFESLAVYLRDGDQLIPGAVRGSDSHLSPIELGPVQSLLARSSEHGCVLVERAQLLPGSAPSTRNGVGELAWNDHCLLVPLHERAGELVGVLIFDDPTDSLKPDPYRRQALRLLADHAAAAIESIERQANLAYLASHDPLTGVRNRRDLSASIDFFAAQPDGLSVLMCDLDNFKQVNDSFGHDLGDKVLQRFGAILREHSRAADIPVRTGGEEFCLVLPAAGCARGVGDRRAAARRYRIGDELPRARRADGVDRRRELPVDGR